jgi:hypothetical protein
MKKYLFFFTAIIASLTICTTTKAQQYKLRQVNTIMGMKSESTIYVKGMRKRTEGGGVMGMGANLVTIEQCDLQRTVRLNEKKKLYYIEPFSNDAEEVIDEDAKAAKTKTVPVPNKEKISQKGGIINMWYNITDTGERKKMYGFTARHVWTSQKIKPSPDACAMKDSIIIKTDGWYIDLPQFNCPVHYKPARNTMSAQKNQPDCKDRFVTRRSGKGKLGFVLVETTTIKMGNANAQTNKFQTSIETLDFSAAKLDSMLFEIPPGYKEATSEDELQDKPDIKEMMKNAQNMNIQQQNAQPPSEKRKGIIRIGVYEPRGDDQIQASSLQQHLVSTISSGNIESIPVSSEEQAKSLDCDYTITTDIIKIKSGTKVGGILKAIKNTDPSAASTYTIDASMMLVKLSDGSTAAQQKISGKYDGKVNEATEKAIDEGCRLILAKLK